MVEILVDGRNYFNEESFNDACLFLEDGSKVHISIDCIGHTRNNAEQENYRRAFVEKYGRKVNIEVIEGVYSYSYKYSLKDVGNDDNK